MTINDDMFDEDGAVRGPDHDWNAVLPGAAPQQREPDVPIAAPAGHRRLPGSRLQQIAAGLVLAGLLVLLAARLLPSTQQTAISVEVPALPLPLPLPRDEPPAETVAPEPAAAIVVYITGAVVAPDVYRLPADARVIDAVAAAGGPADDADLERINLAAPLSDAAQVHIPRRGDAPAAASAAEPPAGASDGLININRADAAELDGLPGVGPALAQRIVEYRNENGPFADAEALNAVSGIGERLLAQISPLISYAP